MSHIPKRVKETSIDLRVSGGTQLGGRGLPADKNIVSIEGGGGGGSAGGVSEGGVIGESTNEEEEEK